MGKITKKATEKHKVSLSPALVDFIQKTTTLPLAELCAHLSSLPTRWPFPRGDLYNWIEPLDRFDSILQKFNEKYGLNCGPQTQVFGNSLLLEASPDCDPGRLEELGFGHDGDRVLVEAILSFSQLLLGKCGNRALYNSSDRLNDLLNTTSLSLLHSTLRITVLLAVRYSERAPNAAQQPHTQFYNYDYDRLNKLASSLASLSTPASKRASSTPIKNAKSKEKSSQSGRLRRSSTSVNPNDFKILARTNTKGSTTIASSVSQSESEQDWYQWVHVKVTWISTTIDTTEAASHTAQLFGQEPPQTPTPARLQSSTLSRTTTSNAGLDTSAISGRPNMSERSGVQSMEFSATDLSKTTIEDVLRDVPDDMPQSTRYDLLHKLRIAYGLMTSADSRRSLLTIRLLALSILAYIYDEHEFPQKAFGNDANPSARSQLIQQIVSLVQTPKKATQDVSLYLQTLAMECLSVLARQRTMANEITIALAPNSSHGLLLSLTEKGLDDLRQDGDISDDAVGDDWREAIFTLLSAFMLHGIHSARSSETVIHPSLISAYASGLGIITGKSLRVHLRILDFMKTFFHHFKDGLAVLSTNKAFEAACELLGKLSQSALALLQQGQGMPEEFKTKVTDYQIPYMHQQVIRSMIDLVNDIIGHQGGHAERILRNLVDSQSLLGAFHLILSNIEAFGAHTWSEVVKAIVGFLHSEPTSYTIISEAGITKTLLEMVAPANEGESIVENANTTDAPSSLKLQIPANGDAIVNLSQAFGAICLTSSGFDTFRASGALGRFFEIFESSAHVKAINNSNTLAMLGSTFDELVRHHPQLKTSVMTTVITMMARVRHICFLQAFETGAGAKLWLNHSSDQLFIPGAPEALSDDFVPRTPSTSQALKPITLPSGGQLEFKPLEAPADPSIMRSAKETDRDGLTVIDYARPAICFLLNFFENQGLCSTFMEHGATDIVLDFTTLPAISPDDQTFGREGIVHELASLTHMMAETKPHLVLPVLVDRARYICQDALKDFANNQPTTFDCYFEKFVTKELDGQSAPTDPTHLPVAVNNGTRTVKGLTAVLTLTTVLSEIFNLPIFANRAVGVTAIFLQVNIADIIADLSRMLGAVSAACYREEIALQRAIPEPWLSATRPGGFSTGDEEVDKVLGIGDTASSGPESGSDQDNDRKITASEIVKQDDGSATFRNVQTLRYLLIETPASISEFLQRLGRGIVMKRRMDLSAKQRSNVVANAIADAFMAQIQPYFLAPTDQSDEAKTKEARFAYLLNALAYVRSSLTDDSPNNGANTARQALVISHFRKAGGLKALTAIGNELFEELKSCKVAQSMFSANTGLKHCLDIFDDLTSFQNICESCQGVWMKESNPTKPFPFNPAQLLLELRTEAIPLTRRIWDSEYADQASTDVVQKLISILKHVFNGDQESEAVQSTNDYPKIPVHQKRKLLVNEDTVSRIATEKECSKDLVREAMFRSHCAGSSNTKPVEEYCDAMKDNPRRRRLPVPDGEIGTSNTTSTSGVRSPVSTPFTNAAALLANATNEGGIEATLAEVVSSIADNDMDDMDDETVHETILTTSDNTSSAMDINNILNEPEETPVESQTKLEANPESSVPLYSVETIDAERESIREELTERCNNILNNHQNLTFELSELIITATKKLSDDATKTFWENTCSLLINTLLSRQADQDINETRGKKIAAAAHLVALLIQDNDVFKTTLRAFQDSFDGLLAFLRLPAVTPQNPEEPSSPWVAPVLLILERMLSLDAEPAQISWDPPQDMETTSPPRLTYASVFSVAQKKELFDLLIGILPRVGKDKAMGLSIVRVLVILTRLRDIAVLHGQRGNLQRLFLMIKQLGSGASGRLQSSFLLILRHIIEDEETITQIMRSEITANFLGRANRPPDITAYVRDNYHLVLRSPDLFVKVTNEKIKLAGWSHQSGASTLLLKDPNTSMKASDEQRDSAAGTNSNGGPTTSIETAQESATESASNRPPETKPPVVEHPDGVIHFLLSELLAYKEVDDKDPSKSNEEKVSNPDQHDPQSQIASHPPNTTNQDTPDKSDKPKFKADDHPIFLYRCFILHCLTELLYSYNRTKVEFINYSRKADPMAVTPSKPRSGILNYLLNALISSGYVEKDETIICKKQMVLSDWAMKVIVALCTKTGEQGLASPLQRFAPQAQVDDQDTEPDLTFVRRFVLEHAIKAFKDATMSVEPLQMKYSRLLCLADLFRRLLSKPSGPDGAAGSHNNSYKTLGRMMFEKNLISVLTSSLAEIDLSFPSAKKVIKFILRPLHELTTVAVHLSINSPETISSVVGTDNEDVISSASSVSDIDDEREETPDLFRNSALGMLDPGRPDESDTSEDEEEDDNDEEMYDDDDFDDEMDYDDGIPVPNDGEVVSDEEGMEDMGPIEGIPGDMPMDIEFVVNGSHDVPTEEEDDDDSADDEEDDDESDEEDDENEDFEIEIDEGGEINDDDGNDSLEEGHDDQGEWEDEDDDEDGVQDDEAARDDDVVAFEGAEILAPSDIGIVGNPHTELNNLLRVLGEQDSEGHDIPPLPPIMAQDEQSEHEQEDDDDDDDDEGEDGDELDENDGMDYDEGFNFIADGLDELDNDGQWDAWGEPPAAIFRRHRQSLMPGRHGLHNFMSRRIHALGGDHHDLPHQIISRHHRHPPQARPGIDDGTNPLLQRSESNRVTRAGFDNQSLSLGLTQDPLTSMAAGRGPGGTGVISVPIPMDINISSDNPHFASIGAHGALLDAIVQALQRGERSVFQAGQFPSANMQVQFNGPFDEMRHMLRPGGVGSHGRHFREDPARTASFTPSLTTARWQEEARMLFGSTYIDKIQRIQLLIMSNLVPLAQEEEKERRRKRAEEDERRKKEAEEAEKRRQEEERVRKEREEREAAERAEAEAKARAEAEAAAAAAAAAVAEAANQSEQTSGETEPMEGVQSTEEQGNDPNESNETDAGMTEPARVFTTIRGQRLDITGLSIDLEYLEALPEELREEVIMQQYTERRENAQEEGGDASAIDPDFLDALPEEIREEIREHEAHNQRRRQREEARRQAQQVAGGVQAEDMDNDNFFATLDPALRRVILAEQPPEILAQLDPRHAAEGRAQQRGLYVNRMMDGRGSRVDDRARRDAAQKDNKRQVVQLIDKAGVATLLRLMFLPQQGSLRQNLWTILRNVCGNRQTRLEVVSLLLVILKEGSTDVTAVERSLASLSLRARATTAQKTPQPLKRTLSMAPQVGLSEDITPMTVVQQCIAALQALCRLGSHVKTIFLREVDIGSSKSTKKNKSKDTKTSRYPINDLIGLLDRRLIMDSSNCLQALAELLSSVTSPLNLLMRREKEQEDGSKEGAPEEAQIGAQGDTVDTDNQQVISSERDTAMGEAPPANPETATSANEGQSSSEDKQESKDENEEAGQDDKKKAFEPPVISEHNLRLVTSVFVAPECHNETFHSTLDTLTNLSFVPGTSVIFSRELVNHVQTLSQAICGDLDELLPLIKEAQSTSDLQGITSAKFSAGSSDQVKLLRVLQALDYLSAPKKDSDMEDESATVKSILNSSYDALSLGPLWNKLSGCLTAVREKGDTIGFANILLPLIESLMVVCKNTPLKDAPVVSQSQEAVLTSPVPEGMNDLEELFFKFTTEHRKILNDIVRQNPKLMQGNGNFSLLVKNSKVLDFDNKRNYFTKQIHSRHHQRHVLPPLQLSIRRDQVFRDSFKNLYYKSAEEMKHGKLNIRFLGEEGVDAGGVTREWFQVLARDLFNPDYALFQPVASDRTTFHPSTLSGVNDEHLLYFKFIGRIIGKALHEGRVLDCHFSRAVYKRILGKSPNLKDLESNDVDYYKSLVWILENDITDILTEEFCVIENNFGAESVIDLIPDGRNISVTEENKREYVQKLVEYRLTTSVKDQLDKFLEGFHDIIPAELIAIFNEQELELLISGLPEIDVDDWKANTEYHNYSPSSPQIVWFWRIVRGMTNEERAKLLQFITGTSKVPLNGFKELEGVSGLTKHNIHKDPSTNRLPTSHTCFNQLDLPAYDSFEVMKQNLTTAINLGADYFGFA